MENEEKEIKEEKDLVEHAAKAVEHVGKVQHVSSETAQEMDENAEIENTKKVEAALFISGRFLTLQELVMLTDINPLMLKEILEKLTEKYNSEKSAIEIIVKEDMWKMDVGQEYVPMINKLATGNAEFTKAEQETLAVIAYKQPVKQSVIIKIRGNKAYDHIKHFVDISLVQAKKSGRTRELRLSDDFFEYFHLQKKGDGSTEVIEVEKNGEEVEKDKSDNDDSDNNVSNDDNSGEESEQVEENNEESNNDKGEQVEEKESEEQEETEEEIKKEEGSENEEEDREEVEEDEEEAEEVKEEEQEEETEKEESEEKTEEEETEEESEDTEDETEEE